MGDLSASSALSMTLIIERLKLLGAGITSRRDTMIRREVGGVAEKILEVLELLRFEGAAGIVLLLIPNGLFS